MTYPPSPNQGVPPYGGPPPAQSGFPPHGYASPPKNSRIGLVVAAAVAAVLVFGRIGGYFIVTGVQGRHARSASSAQAAGTTPSAAGQSQSGADALLKLLPEKQDFDPSWKFEQTVGDEDDSKEQSSMDATYDPPQCDKFAPESTVKTVGLVVAGSSEKYSVAQIKVVLYRWANGSKLDAIDSFISSCSEVKIVAKIKSDDQITSADVVHKPIDPPNVPGASLRGYEEEGTVRFTSATPTTTRPGMPDFSALDTQPWPPSKTYFADAKGVLVFLECDRFPDIQAKCDAVFTSVVSKLVAS